MKYVHCHTSFIDLGFGNGIRRDDVYPVAIDSNAVNHSACFSRISDTWAWEAHNTCLPQVRDGKAIEK